MGIDVTPNRFIDSDVREALDPVVDCVKGLFLTGQDTLICGVTLAQVLISLFVYYFMMNLYLVVRCNNCNENGGFLRCSWNSS